jgi:hypothetical protein
MEKPMYRADDPLEEIVDRLTVPCPDLTGGTVVVFDPLLPRLREAISSSLGGTRSGVHAAHERSLLNVAAFTLYEDLDGRISVLTGDASGWPEDRLRAWKLRYLAEYSRGEVPEPAWLVTLGILGGWVRRIEDLLDPPIVLELLAACPNCGARHIITADLQMSALFAGYRRGADIMARCRVCGMSWLGESQLIALARRINADVNLEALAQFRSTRH